MTLSHVDQGEASSDAVVFVPGPTDSWRSYEPVLAAMPPSLRCIALSQRGHGDSDKPDSEYGVAVFADDLASFLIEKNVVRAVLVGHSGSCPVVRRVALDRPRLVAGLVLEASPLTLAGHPGFTAFVETLAELSDPIDAEFARSFIGDTSAGLDPRDLATLVTEVQKVPVRVWRAMFSDLGAYDDVARLPDIAAPTLLLWGDADPIVDRAMQDELAARIPNADLCVYPGVGHTPRWEDPARFADDVAAFTRRVGI